MDHTTLLCLKPNQEQNAILIGISRSMAFLPLYLCRYDFSKPNVIELSVRWKVP